MTESESSIFRDESKLMPEYVPDSLPYREPQIKQLLSIYRGMIDDPGGAFYKAIAYGPVGTGKTAVSKRVGFLLTQRAERRGVRIHYVHVNCYRERTLFMIAKRIAGSFIRNLPPRGYSAQELLDMAWGYLEDTDSYAFVVVDEFDYIARTSPHSVYVLTRLSDPYLNVPQRMSILFIVRQLSFIYMAERSAVSTLQRNIVEFKPYTAKQIYRIVYERSELALKPGVIDDETLMFIAELAGVDGHGSGDARYALELLWRSGKYAENMGSEKITAEHVRRAQASIHPGVRYEELVNLSEHELLLLLALSSLLASGDRTYVRLRELEGAYRSLCEVRGVRPRRHTRVWSYINRLRNMGIISTRVGGMGGRGRATWVGLIDIPAETLEREVARILGEGL